MRQSGFGCLFRGDEALVESDVRVGIEGVGEEDFAQNHIFHSADFQRQVQQVVETEPGEEKLEGKHGIGEEQDPL